MFKRLLLNDLNQWLHKPNRKPLILRGARQVGKTTLVSLFAQQFTQFIALNLERQEERALFEQNYNIYELFEAIFFLKGKDRQQPNTLLFITLARDTPSFRSGRDSASAVADPLSLLFSLSYRS